RLQSFRDRHHLLIVEIKTGHGVFGLGPFGFFFQAERLALAVELDNPISLRVGDRIGKDLGASRSLRGLAQALHQVMTIKNVVAEDQWATLPSNKLFADE